MTTTPQKDPNVGSSRPRLLTIHDLQALFQCGRTAAYARVHQDDFPAPLALSDSAHRWWESEVLEWLEQHRLVRPARTQCASAPTTTLDQPAADVTPRPVDIHRRRAQ
jgi:predicted DNA-binding transcriptional regulator AlpA